LLQQVNTEWQPVVHVFADDENWVLSFGITHYGECGIAIPLLELIGKASPTILPAA
jgi:hypothetical protein